MIELPIIKKLEEEYEKLSYELKVEVPKELRTAAAHGDLSENAEYDAAKERQRYLQARVNHLSARIQLLSSLKLDDIPKDRVGFGSKVSLEDQETGTEVVYELVTPEEVAPREGKISVSSPIGKAILNKQEGDEVIITLPAGTKEYEVSYIKTIHDIVEDL